MIHKNKRGKNLYKQRVPKGLNLNIGLCKRQAMLDITEECGENRFFTRNYVAVEHVVLAACTVMQEVVPIINHKLYNY